jgi:cobalt-zinc-cadmium efflux system protein
LDGVESVHDLHIWAISTQQNALTAHLVYQNNIDTQNLLDSAHEMLEHQFGIHHSTLQLESKAYGEHCDQKHCV